MLKSEDAESKSQFSTTVEQSIDEEVSKATSNKEKGDRFLEWVVIRLLDTSTDEIRNQITDGKDDAGIDAWIKPDLESENGGVIQLIQCKYGESHDNSKIIKFQEDVDKFLKSKLEDIPRQDMKQLLVMIKKENLEPELIYITNRETDFKSDTIKVKVFGFGQIVNKLWDELVGIPEGIQESIELEELMPYKDTIIGVLSLSQLRKFVNKSQSYIYESNIRKYLQRTKINKGLKKTLENSASNVFYYNNGITIVVKDFKINGKNVTLLEPQIVNGAQTSQTIYEYLPLITDVIGEVQIIIIKESNDTTRKDITQFRNSQNSVKGKDLISLQAFHTGIRGQLKNFGFYYEQQAGAWLFMKPQERATYEGHDEYSKYLPEDYENKIQAKDAIQAMVAGIFENPTQPYSSIASFMPNGRHYPDVFDSKLKENYRLLLYPYLVKCYGERLGFGDLEAKPEQKRYARLLFVTAYFKILFDYILKKDKDEVKQNPELMESIFKNFENNEKLLKLTDEAMDFYFHCARSYFDEHEEIVTWHNFFSKHAWNEKLQKDIRSFLIDKKEEIKEIKQNF